MELIYVLQFIFFGLCATAGIIFIILTIRSKNPSYDYDKIIALMTGQTENNLNILEKGNKEIDEIEEQILKCKKELGLKLFNK